jgi:arginine N-succinyltransferase
MFVIRDARGGDLDGLQQVARHLDSVNLPDDRDRLAQLIAASEESFAGRRDVPDRRLLFVLTESGSDRILGTSMIFAQHGSRRSPHVYFDVLEEERYSQTLDLHRTHRVLRIGYNYKGLTEIGGLVMLPELRGHPERLGTLLSYVRFVYIAAHRAIFRDEVVSELMPPLEADGTSRLWEALGRKFTGLSYQEADRLSHENKEFIRALFPEEPIYATLLPADVQAVIGQVGPRTKGVETMLRRIGFTYANRIDPFDGGPHFHARIDDIALVRAARPARVADASAGAGTRSADGSAASQRVLVTVEDDRPQQPRFRAIASHGPLDLATATVQLSAGERAALVIDVGAEVYCLPLSPSV